VSAGAGRGAGSDTKPERTANMGYLNDTDMSQFIAPSLIVKTAGTWTDTVSGNIWACARTAGAATFNLIIPVRIMSNIQAAQGYRLKSVDVFYKIATANLNNMTTVQMSKMTGSTAHTVATAGSSVTCTLDSSHLTSGNRSGQTDHRMTISLSSPAWVLQNQLYLVYITCDAPATTVFTLYGAQANFEVRL
jgi:hypothetical protein